MGKLVVRSQEYPLHAYHAYHLQFSNAYALKYEMEISENNVLQGKYIYMKNFTN